MIEKNHITNRFLYYGVKRFFDIVFSLFLLICLGPIFIVIVLLIGLWDGLPIFYTWNVHGIQGKKFTGYKFRTMYRFADLEKEKLEALNEMDGPVFKITKDPRITKIGHILRKFSLDELPQIYSVLKGDMSFIGPRPCLLYTSPSPRD